MEEHLWKNKQRLYIFFVAKYWVGVLHNLNISGLCYGNREVCLLAPVMQHSYVLMECELHCCHIVA